MNLEVIKAAGAVLWRDVDGEVFEIAVIHRPRYDDWSLPKGKLERGESPITAARREVFEETGYISEFGPSLGTINYTNDEALKEVYYWIAKAHPQPTGELPVAEVDQLVWLSPQDAIRKVTNETDREIIWRFLEIGPRTYSLVLLRHAKALKRSEWQNDDDDRPLDSVGQVQAKKLPKTFLPYGTTSIYSSDAMRCAETVFPLSQEIGKIITYVSDLSEYMFHKDKNAAIKYTEELIEQEENILVCSHNPILPNVIKKLVGKKIFKSFRRELEPAEAIILHHRDGEVVALDWISAPSSQAI
jgi:8-oxo-dGTP diphosphatase